MNTESTGTSILITLHEFELEGLHDAEVLITTCRFPGTLVSSLIPGTCHVRFRQTKGANEPANTDRRKNICRISFSRVQGGHVLLVHEAVFVSNKSNLHSTDSKGTELNAATAKFHQRRETV